MPTPCTPPPRRPPLAFRTPATARPLRATRAPGKPPKPRAAAVSPIGDKPARGRTAAAAVPKAPPPGFSPVAFVARSRWRFARTLAHIPHEYAVKGKGAYRRDWFVAMVEHIRAHGYEDRWGRRTFIYLEVDGWRYWTMGEPVAETTLINRARI